MNFIRKEMRTNMVSTEKVISEYNELLNKVSNTNDNEKKFELLQKIVKLRLEIRYTDSMKNLRLDIPKEYRELYYEMKNKLHQELKEINHKIYLGNLNKCSVHRRFHKRKKYIAKLLGYKDNKIKNRDATKPKNDKYAYGSYKIVPSESVKIYRGGGCSGK